MKTILILFTATMLAGLFSGFNLVQKANNNYSDVEISNSLHGKWLRIGHTGPVALEFKSNGSVEVDFGNDNIIEAVSEYEIKGDEVHFKDKEGNMCPETGTYKVYHYDYTISFDLTDDNCNGRIKTTMGFWVKPGFNTSLEELDEKISKSPHPSLYLNRARIYLATGKAKQAQSDLDVYLKQITSNAKAYINRAGTKFPNDMRGVVADCDKAIDLEPANKNAYFLKGLALYELGEKERACESFTKAIDLGFSILRIAEHGKCAEFWDE